MALSVESLGLGLEAAGAVSDWSVEEPDGALTRVLVGLWLAGRGAARPGMPRSDRAWYRPWIGAAVMRLGRGADRGATNNGLRTGSD